MCGIAGILNFNGQPARADVIKKMTNSIAHRGPDSEGQWVNGNVGLGHRRLSIIDLSAMASQPMCNDDKSIVITFNGEIYNYKELIPDIRSKGYNFFSSSDTEVILRLYEIYGVECLDRLRGMFAFAIWDKRKQNLFLARDRVGVKPLYYLKTNNYFVFASEIKAILAAGYSQKCINKRAFFQYMRFLTVPQPDTIFEDIHKLEPASYITVDIKGDLKKESYWNIKDNIIEGSSRSENDFLYKMDVLLSESVRYHMVADVPVAAFLSGGLDSSSVVTMMRKNYPDRAISTFSIIFPEIPEYDEGVYANTVSESIKTDHHAYTFNEDFMKDFDEIVWFLDEPFAISSAFASYYLAKNASKQAKVVLTGDGGDELFAGYQGYANNRYLRFPGWLFNILTQLYRGALCSEKKLHIKNKFALRFLTGLGRRVGNEGVRYSEQVAQNSLYAVNMAFNEEFFVSFLETWSDNLMAYYYNALHSEDKLLKKLYSSFMTRLVDEMLMKVDRMTMAHSLEARVPLLDHKLVEFAFSMPSEMKLIDDGKAMIGKYIFKKVMERYLPKDIIYRTKKGFDIPIKKWFKGPFLNEVGCRIRDGYLMKNGILDRKGIEILLKEDDSSRISRENTLISLFAFETWSQGYEGKFGPMTFH